MKKIKIILLGLSLIIISCQKDHQKSFNVSSINIIDASINLPQLFLNFSAMPTTYSTDQAVVSYGGSVELGKPSGNLPLTIVSSADTLHSIFKQNLNLTAGGIYSFFIIGVNPNIQTMMVEDNIPTVKDSSACVRFVNLSPDSSPISINLQGNPSTQIDFSGLSYKQISAFKKYSTPGNISNYTFEIRDAATGNLLTTFTWNFKRFFCNTITITGLENDTTGNYPVSAFQVNNY